MGRIVDITGQRFGKLVVIEYAGSDKKNKTSLWKCLCDCGNTAVVKRKHLQMGNTNSCGCIRSELAKTKTLLPENTASFHKVLDTYKRNAKNRNLSFDLPEGYFYDLITSDCFYCGAKPNNYKKSSPNSSIYYNGIDRIDNTQGYTLGNVVACCSKCNIAKRDMSIDDFLFWVKHLYAHMFIEGGNFGKEVTAISNLQI